ncbi:pectate lyase family protein [Undibacterium flavidum]|uniref:Pectate lyase n=1 Tax=Undibacterium flavidum TaxID=2762297 RepID=A0ABR6Y8U8_9BURK|nr:pectate lyase [Undibacterium flavidum]MBC3872589.1 pectate lyase [Undibacterium flavidum]
MNRYTLLFTSYGQICRTLFAGVSLMLLAGNAGAADLFVMQKQYAYPATMSWVESIQGGRGGQIIRVTNLQKEGAGSLRAALDTKGPRIIVFEVGGVIDLERSVLQVAEPNVTILGQTAPAPGITLIRGGINIRAPQTIIQHLRVRTGVDGQTKASGWEVDGINVSAAHHVLIDHCSISWAIDENMSASGPRFKGETPDDWRNGTSHHVLFSNNIAAEGLAEASHSKGEHSKGSLVHDNVTQIVFYRNIWAHNVERNPLLKGGVQASVVNNLIYNPRAKAIHYNLMALEWGEHAYQLGKLNVVGNVMRGGLSTKKGLPLMSLGGDGDLAYFEKDNIAVDQFGMPLPMLGRYGQTRAQLLVKETPIDWPEGLQAMPAKDVETELLRYAGARPWNRDADDIRILYFIAEGRGTIINDEREVSSYPKAKLVQAKFNEQDWDMLNGIPKAVLR